jgi:hypothetical protein
MDRTATCRHDRQQDRRRFFCAAGQTLDRRRLQVAALLQQGLKYDGLRLACLGNRQAQGAFGSDEEPSRHMIGDAKIAKTRAQQRIDADEREHKEAEIE